MFPLGGGGGGGDVIFTKQTVCKKPEVSKSIFITLEESPQPVRISGESPLTQFQLMTDPLFHISICYAYSRTICINFENNSTLIAHDDKHIYLHS